MEKYQATNGKWYGGDVQRQPHPRPRKYINHKKLRPSLIETYGNRCMVCGVSGEEVKLLVDHDHQTGVIRGLLCPSCNTLLGYHSLKFFESVVRYLSN